jgi:hypothetical protein
MATAVILIEVIWEIIENTPMIGRAYGSTQIYKGDSTLNSQFDIFSMFVGFLFASKLRLSAMECLPILLLSEFVMLQLVRDNLVISDFNMIMHLIFPNRTHWPAFYEALIQWQCQSHPGQPCHARFLWKREVVV